MGYVTDRLYTVDDFDADGKLKPGIAKVEGYNPNPGDILYKDLDGNDIINSGTSTTKDPGDRKSLVIIPGVISMVFMVVQVGTVFLCYSCCKELVNEICG